MTDRRTDRWADNRRVGNIILRSGQGWTLLAQLGQLKAGLCEKGLFVKDLDFLSLVSYVILSNSIDSLL